MVSKDTFIKLLLTHRSSVFGYILGVTNDFHLAEDLFQEVSMIAFKKADTFEQGTNFSAWMREIARLKILEEQRRTGRNGLPVDNELLEKMNTSFSKTESLWEHEKEILKHCLRKLTERVRDMVRMKYEQSLLIKQIAKKIGQAAGAVQVALSRARSSLKKCIDKGFEKDTSK